MLDNELATMFDNSTGILQYSHSLVILHIFVCVLFPWLTFVFERT